MPEPFLDYPVDGGKFYYFFSATIIYFKMNLR